jgi:alpha 1,3-glucosidase
MWMQYPNTEALFSVDDQYLIGSDLMVKPVTAPGVLQSVVKFPTDDIWYDAESLVLVSEKGAANSFVEIDVPSDISTIPVFQRGGSVIARKLWLRRSSQLMKTDPYTLYAALDSSKMAQGALYMDDEETFNHESRGEFAEATFSVDFSTGTIRNDVTVGSGWVEAVDAVTHARMVERIIVMGVENAPTRIISEGETVEFSFDRTSKVLVIRKPNVSALSDWELQVKL